MPRLALGPLLILWIVAGCASPRDPISVELLEEYPEDTYVYTIFPGDVLLVEIAEDPNYRWETTILPDGSASFRYAGELQVMGLTLRETRELLIRSLERYYVSPTMTLQLKRITGPDPIVYLGNWGPGGSDRPASTIGYRRGIGLMEAIALAGGPGEPNIDVAPYVYVVRNIKSIHDRKVYRFDMSAAVMGKSPDLPLHPGDCIFLDRSWLQDLERAVGIFARTMGAATQGLATALLVDSLTE
jgi:protein involved in polysaccharide export with SLBB domain